MKYSLYKVFTPKSLCVVYWCPFCSLTLRRIDRLVETILRPSLLIGIRIINIKIWFLLIIMGILLWAVSDGCNHGRWVTIVDGWAWRAGRWIFRITAGGWRRRWISRRSFQQTERFPLSIMASLVSRQSSLSSKRFTTSINITYIRAFASMCTAMSC